MIARSNLTLLKVAAELDNMKQPYIFVGGVKGYDFDLIRDMALFCSKSEVSNQRNAFLKMFKSKQMLVRYAEETENRELLAKLALIETHGASSVADMCNDVIQNATKNEIKFKSNMTRGNFAILGNVHKSKGLEFSNVLLADDFVNLCDPSVRSVCRSMALLRALRISSLIIFLNSILECYGILKYGILHSRSNTGTREHFQIGTRGRSYRRV